MKLLLFAHTPPPHHGQSYMVQLMLEGLGGDQRHRTDRTGGLPGIACYHVNARLSEGMDDIGTMRGGKVLRLLRYCAEAIWCRLRHGATTFYHIPAPGKRAALYRDWIVLFFCRPFFRHWVMHWHAVGLGEWLEKEANPLERRITYWLFSGASLGISLTQAYRSDAALFRPRRLAIVPNGIPDPCPHYDQGVAAQRAARARARREHLLANEEENRPPLVYNVLFLAHCSRAKGMFDTLEAVAAVNREKKGLQIRLTLAGSFTSQDEEDELRERIARPDLCGHVDYVGFVRAEEKRALLTENDCLCFPSHHESFGLVLLEAMAFGLTPLVTRIKALKELLPDDYPGFVAPNAPEEIKESFYQLALLDPSASLRRDFLNHFSLPAHLEQLQAALHEIPDP